MLLGFTQSLDQMAAKYRDHEQQKQAGAARNGDEGQQEQVEEPHLRKEGWKSKL